MVAVSNYWTPEKISNGDIVGGTHSEGFFFVCYVGCNIVNATKILQQCSLHGDMNVCAFGVRSSSAIIQTQLCKYAFAVSVAVGRMGQSVREREHACVRTHTHTHTQRDRHPCSYKIQITSFATFKISLWSLVLVGFRYVHPVILPKCAV